MIPAVASILLAGCVPSAATVQPLVDARSQALALDASLALRLASGTAALAAAFCAWQAEDWQAVDGGSVDAPAEVAANLDIRGSGELRWRGADGEARAVWSPVVPEPGLELSLELVMRPDTGQHEARLDSEGGPGVTVGLPQSSCDELAELDAGLELVPVQGDSQHLDLAGTWSPGSMWPEQGAPSWARGSGATLEEIEGEDASAIEAGAWPAVARAEDWEAQVEVPLERPSDATQ